MDWISLLLTFVQIVCLSFAFVLASTIAAIGLGCIPGVTLSSVFRKD